MVARAKNADATVQAAMLAKLAGSGLDAKDAKRLGMVACSAAEARLKLPRLSDHVAGFTIPYFKLDGKPSGLHRYRYLESTKIGFAKLTDEKPKKYNQEKGSPVELYLAPFVDWAAIAADAAQPITITEGELKAACATKHGLPTIGLGGVWNFRSKDADDAPMLAQFGEFHWTGRTVYIAYDSDAHTNPNVVAAESKLSKALAKMGATPLVVRLPQLVEGEKTGLDDFIMARGIDALCDRLKYAIPPWVAEMNAEFLVVDQTGRFVVFKPYHDPVLNRNVIVRYRRQDFEDLHHHKRVEVGRDKDGNSIWKPIGAAWLGHWARRQYSGGAHFLPGQKAPRDVFNLWTGWGVEPKPGDWSRLKAHLLDNVCDGHEEYFAYLMGWLACAVQRLDEPGHVALVMRGGRGVGKGKLAHWLGHLFGQHYIYLTNARSLVGNFNVHLQDALVVFADEAFWAGDRQHESTLKGLITDPLLHIEPKHFPAFQARNHVHLIMASNSEWVVPAGVDERRFFVLDVADHKQQDTAYFAAIDEQMENGGAAAMLHELMTYDLTGFQVRDVPKTEALISQKLQSLDSIDKWWLEALSRGGIAGEAITRGRSWSDPIAVEAVYSSYREHAEGDRTYRILDERVVGKRLRDIVPRLKRDRMAVPSDKGLTRPYFYIMPLLSDCRAAFEQHIGGPIEWDDLTDIVPEKKPSKFAASNVMPLSSRLKASGSKSR